MDGWMEGGIEGCSVSAGHYRPMYSMFAYSSYLVSCVIGYRETSIFECVAYFFNPVTDESCRLKNQYRCMQAFYVSATNSLVPRRSKYLQWITHELNYRRTEAKRSARSAATGVDCLLE